MLHATLRLAAGCTVMINATALMVNLEQTNFIFHCDGDAW